eukprot:365424-Chlamydomonas_euryale.AAC.14
MRSVALASACKSSRALTVSRGAVCHPHGAVCHPHGAHQLSANASGAPEADCVPAWGTLPPPDPSVEFRSASLRRHDGTHVFP